MSRASDNYSYNWCPECKKWVPANCMTAEYDPVDDILVRSIGTSVCSVSSAVGFDVHCAASRGNLATVLLKWST